MIGRPRGKVKRAGCKACLGVPRASRCVPASLYHMWRAFVAPSGVGERGGAFVIVFTYACGHGYVETDAEMGQGDWDCHEIELVGSEGSSSVTSACSLQ